MRTRHSAPSGHSCAASARCPSTAATRPRAPGRRHRRTRRPGCPSPGRRARRRHRAAACDGRRAARRSARRGPSSRVEPSMSVKSIVTVPAGTRCSELTEGLEHVGRLQLLPRSRRAEARAVPSGRVDGRGSDLAPSTAHRVSAAVVTPGAAPGRPGGGASRRWLSTTASATSASLRPVRWECSRSSSKASVRADALRRHEDALRLLDHRPSTEGTLEALVLGEPLQRDVDRTRESLRLVVQDVGEDSAPGGFADVGSVLC